MKVFDEDLSCVECVGQPVHREDVVAAEGAAEDGGVAIAEVPQILGVVVVQAQK